MFGRPFDVILTDLNLPDINGIEMVKQSKCFSGDRDHNRDRL